MLKLEFCSPVCIGATVDAEETEGPSEKFRWAHRGSPFLFKRINSKMIERLSNLLSKMLTSF